MCAYLCMWMCLYVHMVVSVRDGAGDFYIYSDAIHQWYSFISFPVCILLFLLLLCRLKHPLVFLCILPPHEVRVQIQAFIIKLV